MLAPGREDDDLASSLSLIFISLGVELANAAVMTWLFWAPRGLSMLQRLHLLYANPRFFLLSVFFFAGVLQTTLVSNVKHAHLKS